MSTVSKNIFWSSVTSLLQVYTGSVVFIVLAKLMTVEDFGILSFGFSLAAILVICADFGFSLMIMKDYPEFESNPKKYVSNSLMVKVLFSCVVFGISLIYLLFLYDGKWRMVGGIFLLFAIVSSFIVYFQSLLKVQNKFNKYTETTVVYALFITFVLLGYWILDISLVGLAGCLLFCRILQLLWSFFLCKDLVLITSFSLKTQEHLIKKSWSFGLHTVLGIFYFMIDTQIISIYLDAKAVALYQAVFRIILVLLIASEMLSNVLLPYLSFKYCKKEDLDLLISKLFLFLLIIGCSLFLLFTTFSEFIIQCLYSEEYLYAIPLVLPLSIVLIIRTVCSLLGNILTISNKQVYRVKTVLISLLISLTFNFAFIPVYGIIAAAWVSVIVHFSMFILYFYYSKMEVKSVNFFSIDVILISIGTILLFLGIEWFSFVNSFTVQVFAVLLWVVLVAAIMKRNSNLVFLYGLMRDKGV